MADAVNIMEIEEVVAEKGLWTSIDMESREGKRKAYNAQGQADLPQDVLRQKAFAVEHVLFHNVELVNQETGEKTVALRTVLISPDDETVAFMSDGVASGIKKLMGIFGIPPWNPPLSLGLKEVRTRAGRRTYNLDLVE